MKPVSLIDFTIVALLSIVSLASLAIQMSYAQSRIAKLEARVHQLTEMIAPNLLIGEKQ